MAEGRDVSQDKRTAAATVTSPRPPVKVTLKELEEEVVVVVVVVAAAASAGRVRIGEMGVGNPVCLLIAESKEGRARGQAANAVAGERGEGEREGKRYDPERGVGAVGVRGLTAKVSVAVKEKREGET